MDILAKVNESETETPGALTDGVLFATIKNIGKTTALVNGVNLEEGLDKKYPFVGKGYQGISYDPNGSKLRIMQIL